MFAPPVDYTSSEISDATLFLEFAVQQEKNKEYKAYLIKILAVMRAVNKVTAKEETTRWLSRLSNT